MLPGELRTMKLVFINAYKSFTPPGSNDVFCVG